MLAGTAFTVELLPNTVEQGTYRLLHTAVEQVVLYSCRWLLLQPLTSVASQSATHRCIYADSTTGQFRPHSWNGTGVKPRTNAALLLTHSCAHPPPYGRC
jgi:hypothetical protein